MKRKELVLRIFYHAGAWRTSRFVEVVELPEGGGYLMTVRDVCHGNRQEKVISFEHFDAELPARRAAEKMGEKLIKSGYKEIRGC